MNGRAVGKGFVANKELGDYLIRVTASCRGEATEAELRQTNAWLDSVLAYRKIKVTLNDGRVVKGSVSELRKAGFTVVDQRTKQPVSIANEEVAKVAKLSQRLSTSQKVGIGVAVGVVGLVITIVAVCGNGCN
jgi:hypothetical protein